MQKYLHELDQNPGGSGPYATMIPHDNGEYYLASEVDARIAELEGLLREAEGLLCDPQGGRASNELAEKILRFL